jgi:hypothetical protein
MSSLLSTIRAYLDFSLKLRSHVHNILTETEARQIILERLTNREENFIQLLKTNVFDHPSSPYLPLFRAAQLTHDDVKKLIIRQGIEVTLEELYDAGIYITFEEYKGRVPIKRGALEFQVKDSDFDNLNLTSILSATSGGSTGKPTRSKMDLDYLASFANHTVLRRSVHGLVNTPIMMWCGILPDVTGVRGVLVRAHFGQTVGRWFSTYRGNESNTGWRYIILTYLMIIMARFHGLKFPLPEHTPLDNPLPIAKTLAETVHEHGSACLRATASKCVRVSVIAKKHGIDLTGVTYMGSSEPITPAKLATIQASGAKYISVYGTTEAGIIGTPCANPIDITDTHFLSDKLALIQRPVKTLHQTVDAFHFTSLLPTNPKLLINVQSDDYGIVEERDCGCPYYQMGFTTHLRQMSSFRKLTGEGVTLVGSDMVHILEHILPSQFGGSLLDYQLVEEETPQGFTKLILYVDPSVAISDESALLEAFLEAMKQSMPSVRLAQAEYRTGNVATIRREKPFLTSRGKHFPIRTLKLEK